MASSKCADSVRSRCKSRVNDDDAVSKLLLSRRSLSMAARRLLLAATRAMYASNALASRFSISACVRWTAFWFSCTA